RPEAAEPLVAKAEAQAAIGDAAAAVTTAERVVKLQKESGPSYLFLAGIQQRVGRNADALKTYRLALGKDPKDLGALRGIAAVQLREGRSAEAIKTLQEAASAQPKSPLPLIDMAQILERQGRIPEAIDAYREGLRRTPDEVILMNNLAYLLSRTPAGLAEAGSLSERAYQRAPRNVSIMDTRGWVLYQQGAADRAVPLLEEASRSLPGNAEVQ